MLTNLKDPINSILHKNYVIFIYEELHFVVQNAKYSRTAFPENSESQMELIFMASDLQYMFVCVCARVRVRAHVTKVRGQLG